MAMFGYARVSTVGQTLDAQVATLKAAGAVRVFRETASGARPTGANWRARSNPLAKAIPALMGLHREHLELIHGVVGAGVASFLALVAIVGINLIRVRDDLFARS